MNAAEKARHLAEQINYYQTEQQNLLQQIQNVLQNATQARTTSTWFPHLVAVELD